MSNKYIFFLNKINDVAILNKNSLSIVEIFELFKKIILLLNKRYNFKLNLLSVTSLEVGHPEKRGCLSRKWSHIWLARPTLGSENSNPEGFISETKCFYRLQGARLGKFGQNAQVLSSRLRASYILVYETPEKGSTSRCISDPRTFGSSLRFSAAKYLVWWCTWSHSLTCCSSQKTIISDDHPLGSPYWLPVRLWSDAKPNIRYWRPTPYDEQYLQVTIQWNFQIVLLWCLV